MSVNRSAPHEKLMALTKPFGYNSPYSEIPERWTTRAMNDHAMTGAYQPDSPDSPAGAAGLPPSIGRYRVERILGQGGFGLVYLAQDEKLQRLVAIKVPHRDRVSNAEDAEAYLTEART